MKRLALLLGGAIALTPAVLPAAATPLLPHPTRFTLPEGLKVIVVERHDLPLVSLQLVVRAGAVQEPAGAAGASSMVASMLLRGTTTRSAEAIAAEGDALGGGLSAGSDADSAEVGTTVLSRDLAHAASLMGDVVAHPTFPTSELTKEKDLTTAGLTGELDDPGEVASLATSRALYGTTSYGRPAAGGTEAVKALAPETLRAFYRANWRPERAFLVVVGDVTPEKAREAIAPAFADWRPGAAQAGAGESPEPVAKARVQLVDMDVSQANVSIAYPAIARNHPDYFPYLLASQILGGGYLSRLYKHVREEQGLAYSVYSSGWLRERSGASLIVLQTREEAANQALKTVFDQVESLRDRPVDGQELEAVKTYFLGRFPRDLETNSDLASLVGEIELCGLGDSYLDRYAERVRAVTASDVQRVMRTYFAPVHCQITVVGHAIALRKALAPYGDVLAVDRSSLVR